MTFFQKLTCFFFLFSVLHVSGQHTDTVVALKEVMVNAYPGKQTLFRSAGSVTVLDRLQLRSQPEHSLVPALNSVPGVRMEERSPGSYRLSIRGSLLRSPFGIRNVKIYMDEFPLTDAGGNTYVNLLDPESIKQIEVLKGPEGSLFGANTGGVILMQPTDKEMDSTQASVSVSTGSYGLFHERVAFDKQWKNYRLNVTQAYQRSDGYRENSGLSRHYLQTVQQWNYRPKASFKLLAIFSDLRYETPGGLTLNQWNDNPRAARPATATLPGASDQHAGVVNTTIYGGLSHEINLLKNLRHVATVFGSHTNFENPFITNYEVRNENSVGIRTFLELKRKEPAAFNWKWNIGLEGQQTQSAIVNYGNSGGKRDTLQTSDNVAAGNYFAFSRFTADLNKRWSFEGAVSVNKYQVIYRNNYPDVSASRFTKNFRLQVLPRIAFSYLITPSLVWRASVSKGYSPPSIAEIRPSNNTIYAGLQAESGWNYETGFRLRTKRSRFQADVTFFYFRLNNAIVRRTDINGAEYFVNAGGTLQPGIEVQLSSVLIKQREKGFIREVRLRNSFSYYHFYFSDYQVDNTNLSGNRITGVPPVSLVSRINVQLPAGIYFFMQNSYTDPIALDDANTTFSRAAYLMQIRVGWEHRMKDGWKLELYIAADNVLDKKYSLGYDLNAAGGRYYNAAPGRNFFGGVKVIF